MFKSTGWLPIISGARRDFSSYLWRSVLFLVSIVYRVGVGIRNLAYDVGWLARVRAELPVISVGNLTTGGTGKSPFVMWLAKYFRDRNVRVCVLSRGYRSDSSGANDESKEFSERLPEVPQLIDPNRVRSAAIAAGELEMQLAILDDGFQHRRLRRDLDIVLIDATLPFGFGFCLPRGLLRESIRSLRRADWVLVTRSEQVPASIINQLVRTVSRYVEPNRISVVATRPAHLVRADGRTETLESVADQAAFCFCGLGNPESFFRTAAALFSRTVGAQAFPDHHAFSQSDLDAILELAKKNGAKLVVCTHKDLVKIGRNQIGDLSLFALVIELIFTAGQVELEQVLQRFASPAE